MSREATERVEAVLLDAFGTLVTIEPPGPHLRTELAARGVEVTEESATAAFRAEIGYYLAHHLDGRDAASLDDLRDRCAQVIVDALDAPAVELPTAKDAMLAALRFSAFADAAPALRALRRRGLRLVVASNWDASLAEVLERAGLGPLVDAVVSSAEVGAPKPAPELFAAALERAGVPASRALHVGDSIAGDVEGARAAGLRTVLMVRDDPLGAAVRALQGAPEGAPAVPTIGDLRELRSLV